MSQSYVQQSTNSLASPQHDLFSPETQKDSEGNDNKSGDDEDDSVGLVSPVYSPGYGNEQERKSLSGE